jgi:hypothetical protein
MVSGRRSNVEIVQVAVSIMRRPKGTGPSGKRRPRTGGQWSPVTAIRPLPAQAA